MAISERKRLTFTTIAVIIMSIVTGLLIVSALLPSTTPTAALGSVEVIIINSIYEPETITVPVGTTVTWTNEDSATHTVSSTTWITLTNRLFHSGGRFPFSYTFTEPGVYKYECFLHTSMRGTVIVE